MKALEILKSLKSRVFHEYEVWGEYKESSLDEAIAELKSLQKPKTCETCKCGEPVLSGTKIWCKSDKSPIGNINGLALPKTYGCIHHEPKG